MIPITLESDLEVLVENLLSDDLGRVLDALPYLLIKATPDSFVYRIDYHLSPAYLTLNFVEDYLEFSSTSPSTETLVEITDDVLVKAYIDSQTVIRKGLFYLCLNADSIRSIFNDEKAVEELSIMSLDITYEDADLG